MVLPLIAAGAGVAIWATLVGLFIGALVLDWRYHCS